MIDLTSKTYVPLGSFLEEYCERNENSEFRPVAVGRFGIRPRESIYSKELAKDYSKNKLIHENTLTVGMGAAQIDIGILTDNVTHSVSPAYHTYRISGIDSAYLRYCLQCRNLDMFERYVKRGSRQGKTIDLKRWMTYKIPVYNIEVQKEIVIRLQKVLAIIALKQEQLRILNELVKMRFLETFKDASYPQVLIGDIVDPCIQKVKKVFQQDDLIRYIDISAVDNKNNVITGHTEYMLAEAPSRAQQHVRKDDILISTVRPNLRNVAIVTYEHSNLVASSGFCVLRAVKCAPLYLKAVVCSDDFTNSMSDLATGAHYPAIKDKDVMNYLIPLPPQKTQDEFASLVTQTEHLKFVVQKSIDETQLLFDSLMQKYFS